MVDQQKMEEKYMQFQSLQQHLELINQHVEKMQEQRQEIESTIDALNELEKSKTDTEILAPIANGIFVKAKLLDPSRLTVNLGSDIAAEKSIPEILKLLEDQKEKITNNMSEAEEVFKRLRQQSLDIYNQAQ